MKRFGPALLVLMLLLTPIAYADEAEFEVELRAAPHRQIVQSSPEMSMRYTLITSLHGACYIEKGKIYMSGTVSGTLATYAKVTLVLQKNTGSGWKDNGGTWSATGTKSATKMAEATPSAGVLYRLKITGYLSNATTSESDTIYSGSVAL